MTFPHAAVEPTTADRLQALRDNNDVRCPVCFRDIDFSELGHQVLPQPQYKESIAITSEDDSSWVLHNQEASSPRPQHRRRSTTRAAEESDKDSAATVASPPPQHRRPSTINTPETSNANAAATVPPSVASTIGTPETTTLTHAEDETSSISAATIPPPASTGAPEPTTPNTNEPSSSRIPATDDDEANSDTDTHLSRSDLVTMTACNHVICASCQLTWLQAEAGGRPFFYSSSCALCRHSTLTPEHLQQQQQRASAATTAEATATFRADLLLTPAPAAPTPLAADAFPSAQLAFYASSFDHAVRSLTPIRATTAHLIRAGAAITALLASRPAADAVDPVPAIAIANGADDDDVHGFARPALTAPHFLGAAAALPDFAEGVVRVLDHRDTGTGVGSVDAVWRALVSMLLGRYAAAYESAAGGGVGARRAEYRSRVRDVLMGREVNDGDSFFGDVECFARMVVGWLHCHRE
ncbi:hypothetical protein SLS55_005842 [Diplodia seriata]|uniref:RING-type domain-containing protein n=1 Tax=Diplodia seriata TaxID=420778 RepID=A0ABR3CHI8_9PEZI